MTATTMTASIASWPATIAGNNATPSAYAIDEISRSVAIPAHSNAVPPSADTAGPEGAWYKPEVRGSLGVSIGVVIGLGVGAAGMYLALHPPWGHGAAAPTNPEVIAAAPPDGGVPTKRRGKGKRGRHGGNGALSGGAGGGDHLPTIDGTFGPDDDGGDDDSSNTPAITLSGADRALEWRGDAIGALKQSLDMSSGGEARSLDDNEIDAVVGSQAGGAQDCVVKGATGTDLHATISIKMIVDGKGKVVKSRVHAPRYLFEHGLLACTQRALAKLRFPAVGMSTQVDFPISLD